MIVNGDNFKATLTGLDPDTKYEVKVKGQVEMNDLLHESGAGSSTGTTGKVIL